MAGAVSKEKILDLSLGNLICGRPSVEANVFYFEIWDWYVAGAVSKEKFLDLSLGNLICGRPSVEANVFYFEFGIGTWQAQFLRKNFWT